jgi:hypothetical protein
LRGGEKLHRLIPNSHLHRLEGLTHGLYYYEEARALTIELIEQLAAAAVPRKHGWTPHAI